jgi:hypothetical protein
MPGLAGSEEHKYFRITDVPIIWFWSVTTLNLGLVLGVGTAFLVIPTGFSLDTGMPIFRKRDSLQSIVRVWQLPLGQQGARWRQFAGSDNRSRRARRYVTICPHQ